MENTVTYQNAPYTVTIKQLWWQKQGLQQTATGYGGKLTTEYTITLPDMPRPYRVYAICYSNCASFYILRGGKMLFLRDYELEESRDIALAKQSLLNAAAHLMCEYMPATSTIGHSHFCYSGDLAAVDILRKLAS
jgi:hypothetical protein